MARSSHRSLVLWLGMAAAILLFDQFTKLLVISRFELGDSQAVTSYFNLVRVHNSGAAFSFLSTASGWQRWLFTGIGVA
ncbi:MAG: signal peptidase II, partial [Betaproteobacteria bacterium]|nr:signal peptidase II [Betaproteobacteria bacterium]